MPVYLTYVEYSGLAGVGQRVVAVEVRDADRVDSRLLGLLQRQGPFWFTAKVLVFLFFYVWMRGTLPRFRYDQLMAFGWKLLLPVALANLVITAFVIFFPCLWGTDEPAADTFFCRWRCSPLRARVVLICASRFIARWRWSWLWFRLPCFILLGAEFIAAVQIIVYAGAVMVLFVLSSCC